MNRRSFLRRAAPLAVLPALPRPLQVALAENAGTRRVRPGDPSWPSEASWAKLNDAIGGRLIKVKSPLSACREAPDGTACGDLFKELKNPYYLGDEVALTQSLGWVGAWTSEPSVYAVAAKTDVRDIPGYEQLRCSWGYCLLRRQNACVPQPDFEIDASVLERPLPEPDQPPGASCER